MFSGSLGIGSIGQFAFGAIGKNSQIIPEVNYPPAARTFLLSDCSAYIKKIAYKTMAEVIDFAIAWTGDSDRSLVEDEIIETSAWSVFSTSGDSALSVNSQPSYIEDNNATAVVWLSGGTVNTLYIITNTITTNFGRTFQESFSCYVTTNNFMN